MSSADARLPKAKTASRTSRSRRGRLSGWAFFTADVRSDRYSRSTLHATGVACQQIPEVSRPKVDPLVALRWERLQIMRAHERVVPLSYARAVRHFRSCGSAGLETAERRGRSPSPLP